MVQREWRHWVDVFSLQFQTRLLCQTNGNTHNGIPLDRVSGCYNALELLRTIMPCTLHREAKVRASRCDSGTSEGSPRYINNENRTFPRWPVWRLQSKHDSILKIYDLACILVSSSRVHLNSPISPQLPSVDVSTETKLNSYRKNAPSTIAFSSLPLSFNFGVGAMSTPACE